MVFCAHIRDKDKTIQSVAEHCMNVAKLSRDYADSVYLDNCAEIQGVIHDIGKLCLDFNDYINGSDKFRRGSIDHSFAGAKYMCEFADRLDKEKLHSISRLIARTIISHHGLNDWIDDVGTDCFEKRILKTDRYDEIKANITAMIDEKKLEKLMWSASEEYETIRKKIKQICDGDGEKYAFYMGMLERLLQSILIDADRTDTADFMSDCKTEKLFDTQALWKDMKIRMSSKLDSFADKNDKISLQRKSISDRCAEFAKHKVGICKMLVPTGGGKTLSSLRFAIDYCCNYNMKKIIYIAPFMSILEQNSDVIREVAGNEIFLEHHSDIVAEIENENELSEYELRTEKWDSPVIATTMVQFLNTLFLGKSSSIRRMHRLSKAVIIIDEVQSIPLKCVKMFTLAMNFLSTICGCTIIFSSATQPDFSSTGYNVNFDELDSMTGDYTQDFEIFKRTDIIPQIDKYGYTYEKAAEFVYNKYIENGNILIVVNTKAAAHSIYELIKKICIENNDDAEVIHLSTNMCPQHRRDKISEIKSLLSAKKAVICVTTQLIEAGVDISFKCVVRSLAGMDSIAQAAGRCNRNGEADEICSVYVINLRDENLGSLQEIKDAQGIANRIFDNSSCTDYLSADTIGTYFRCLYSEDKDISYNVCEIGDTLFNLISRNKKRFEICNNKQIKYCGQAFKTAGKLFNVIDSNTTDVIVPYNEEANEIISKLNSDITPNEAIEILRKAQKYIVGLYSSTSKKLADRNGMYALKCGAMALNKEYYNGEYGLDIDGGTMETLMM